MRKLVKGKTKTIVALFVGAIIAISILSSEVRRILENAYIGAPFILAYNKLRPQLDKTNHDDCLNKLRLTDLAHRKVDDRNYESACPIVNAVALAEPLARIRYMTCGLALTVQNYYDQILQPLAMELFNQPVVLIHDLGVRNCRTISGHRFLLSEHAYANAIDISAFELGDGTMINVKRDWAGNDQSAHFLRQAAKGACELFSLVLSPDYNEAHKDHFHLDMGLAKGCEVADEMPELQAVESELPQDYKRLKIVHRSDWGWTPSETNSARHTPKKITIHHSGNTRDASTDPAAYLQNLQKLSRQEKNWSDIPYHYLIDSNGIIYEGRPTEYVGETNTEYDLVGHLHISVIGNYEIQKPTTKILDSLNDLIEMLHSEFDITPEETNAHKDFVTTICPGKHLYNSLVERKLTSSG